MGLLGNIIWILCGGFISFLGYMLGGIALCITIIGIPFGMQAFKIGWAILTPFGRETIELEDPNRPVNLVLNAIWLVTVGFSIAVNHIFWAAVLALTIVGIPFAYQHLKLCLISLVPFGRDFVPRPDYS